MSQLNVSGSCLCSSVQFKASGEMLRFSHCHCSRCRKATGTGHASNLLLTPISTFSWTQGEEKLSRYKVLDAERFYNCFCRNCGSPMPRIIPELDAVLIPAGSLDTEIDVKPQHHIFWDSRASWSCTSAELPVYSEYPT